MVFFPMKVAERNNSYYGIPYSDATEIAEELSSWLRYYNVPELDLTDIKNFSGLTEQEAFFRTDQHWTPNLAFEGYREILEWLGKEFGAEIESKKQFSDINNYKKVTLKNVMLGSQGREAGLFFSGGTEDITVIYPEAKTRYTLKRGRLEEYETIEGTFEQALLNFADIANEDIYSGGAERIYLHNGIDEFVSISNHDTTSKEKILILRDSFATPIGAFLAQSFQQTDMLWSESIEEDELADFLAENHYDYVLVMLYPENLDSKSFPFGMEKTP